MDDQERAVGALDAALGPFYDSAGLQAWLGAFADDVHELARDGRLLSVPTAEGELLFPIFQFDSDGAVLPRLDEVLKVMRDGDQGDWATALWLVNHDPHDGTSAVELLQAGEADTVLLHAAQWIENWKH